MYLCAGQSVVVATVKSQSGFHLESNADIYIHNVGYFVGQRMHFFYTQKQQRHPVCKQLF